MAAPYTQRFVQWDGAAGVSSYQVPPGHRVVVRSITAWASAASSGVNLVIGGQYVWLWISPGVFAATTASMYVVAYAGELVSVAHDGARTGGQVAGYIFTDAAGPLGASAELGDGELGDLERPSPQARTPTAAAHRIAARSRF